MRYFRFGRRRHPVAGKRPHKLGFDFAVVGFTALGHGDDYRICGGGVKKWAGAARNNMQLAGVLGRGIIPLMHRRFRPISQLLQLIKGNPDNIRKRSAFNLALYLIQFSLRNYALADRFGNMIIAV